MDAELREALSFPAPPARSPSGDGDTEVRHMPVAAVACRDAATLGGGTVTSASTVPFRMPGRRTSGSWGKTPSFSKTSSFSKNQPRKPSFPTEGGRNASFGRNEHLAVPITQRYVPASRTYSVPSLQPAREWTGRKSSHVSCLARAACPSLRAVAASIPLHSSRWLLLPLHAAKRRGRKPLLRRARLRTGSTSSPCRLHDRLREDRSSRKPA